MQAKSKNTLGVVLLVAVLTGCATDAGRYPSLAMRPFESGPAPETPAPPQVIRPATPAARLAELRGAATASHAAFLAREDDAGRLVRSAAGQPFESASRAAALVALADLDSKRGATAGTLAALDTLAAEAAAALSPDPALSQTQTEVAALLAREDEGIARLWKAMGS
jgi:glucose/arabinose dehydrogenase